MSQISDEKVTPAPWFVGAQNDALYVIVGEPPSLNNDYPRHDAKREVVAKVYTNAADARLIAAAPELLAICQHLATITEIACECGLSECRTTKLRALLAKVEGRS